MQSAQRHRTQGPDTDSGGRCGHVTPADRSARFPAGCDVRRTRHWIRRRRTSASLDTNALDRRSKRIRSRFAPIGVSLVEPETMKLPFRSVFLTLAFVAASGVLGAWVGMRVLQPVEQDHQTFHENLFAELSLSKEQQAMMDALEARHAAEIEHYKDRVAEANRTLVETIDREETYNDAVDDTVVNVHSAMLDLQKATIRHLYEMREILTPEQQLVFDRHVKETLKQITP